MPVVEQSAAVGPGAAPSSVVVDSVIMKLHAIERLLYAVDDQAIICSTNDRAEFFLSKSTEPLRARGSVILPLQNSSSPKALSRSAPADQRFEGQAPWADGDGTTAIIRTAASWVDTRPGCTTT